MDYRRLLMAVGQMEANFVVLEVVLKKYLNFSVCIVLNNNFVLRIVLHPGYRIPCMASGSIGQICLG